MDYGLRMMLGGGMFFWIIPLLLLLIVIFAAFKAFDLQRQPVNKQTVDPKEIIKVRYAKGELTEEEYLKMKEQLER